MQPMLLMLVCLSASAVSSSAALQNVSKTTDNPADQLVAVINSNRTAAKQPALRDNSGLACIALQYIKAYQGDCGSLRGSSPRKPPNSDIADKFAPKCGVTVSTLAPITGRFVACQTKYVKPAEAFSEVIIDDSKSLEILYNKNHTQVGAAVSGSDGGSPYFWCVLFSNGTNTSFASANGSPIISRPGCFSGANDQCSDAHSFAVLPFVLSVLIAFVCVLLI